MLNDEWLKKKLWEQEVKKWLLRFKQANGNIQEWHKVYQDYLKSSIWAEKRKLALNRADNKCKDCGAIFVSASSLDVHHLTYDRVGGNEKLDDLKVLCYTCHQKADKRRDKKTDERRKDRYYRSRLNGFASRKYGDLWQDAYDEEEVEIEFITFLYRKHCAEWGVDFDPHFDPETDWDFIDFWNEVLDGNY